MQLVAIIFLNDSVEWILDPKPVRLHRYNSLSFQSTWTIKILSQFLSNFANVFYAKYLFPPQSEETGIGEWSSSIDVIRQQQSNFDLPSLFDWLIDIYIYIFPKNAHGTRLHVPRETRHESPCYGYAGIR